MKIQNIDGFIEKVRQAHTPDHLMTTSTTADFADTTERAHFRKLKSELETFMERGFYYKIRDEHLDALKFYRNDQIQEVLKYSDNGKA